MTRTHVAPTLVLAWGNPSRGDDALGPRFVELLEERFDAERHAEVECLTDFQLQVEHALDLVGRRRVLFVDASVRAQAPFEVHAVAPARDASFTTHAMSPEAVLHAYREVTGDEPPPGSMLEIHAESFELGAPPAAAAEAHLHEALAWAERWLAEPGPGAPS